MIAAACHVHSDWSYDGKLSISALAEEFGRRGFRVLMMTEHDRGFTESRRQAHRQACAAASSSSLLVVPGIEYSDSANRVHVLVWGPVPFLGENLPTTELLDRVKAANGIAVLAHPSRKDAWQVFEHSWASVVLGIEVWNRKTDGWSPSEKGFRLVRETGCLPFVGMDFHTRNQFFPLSTVLDTHQATTEDAVLDCLRSRKCHSEALGRPIESAADGWFNLGLHSAERCRRSAATLCRSVEQWLR